MNNNNIEKQQDIIYMESCHLKFFFIGFICALIPYIFISILFKEIITYNTYKYTFIIVAIITATINGLILNHKAIRKLKKLINEKYPK